MPRLYRYVGSQSIYQAVPKTSHRLHVVGPESLVQWIHETKQPRELDGTVVVTFIINAAEELWVNDRRSEHVLCAAGEDVLSAGEMTFALKPRLEVTEVSNQSTGYCPEPETWSVVDDVLSRLGIPHPGDFTMICIFRHCDQCQTLNLVKDDWFECAVCSASLSETWNLGNEE